MINFVGKDALLKIKDQNPTKSLAMMILKDILRKYSEFIEDFVLCYTVCPRSSGPFYLVA